MKRRKVRKIITIMLGMSITICSLSILALDMEDTYKLYTMKDGGKVANTPPVISGVSDVTIKVGENFDRRAGIRAYDKENGDLTGNIQIQGHVDTNQEGVYTLTYTVTDSQGVTTTAVRRVIVVKKPNTPPVIQGVYDTTIKVGEAFNAMAGVTAYDEEDGDLTGEILLSGFVNNNVAGSYTVEYSVTDSEGTTTTANRVVIVVNGS